MSERIIPGKKPISSYNEKQRIIDKGFATPSDPIKGTMPIKPGIGKKREEPRFTTMPVKPGKKIK